MRPLLCLLLLTGCAVPTEPRVVQRQALQTMAPLDWPYPKKWTGATPILCESRPDTVTLWIDGVPYREIVEQCW